MKSDFLDEIKDLIQEFDLEDYFSDLNLNRIDLDDFFNSLDDLKFLEDFNLEDLYSSKDFDFSDFQNIDLDDVFASIGDLGNSNDFDLEDFFEGFSELDELEDLTLEDVFGELPNEFDGLADDITIGDVIEGFSDFYLGGSSNTVDLFDGLVSIVDVLDESGVFDDFQLDDLFRGGGDRDVLRGLQTSDLLLGYAENDRLNGLLGDDLLNGGEGNDVLRGFKGKDLLVGQVGVDVLSGGEGDDLLAGGGDRNIAIGGDGRDQFLLAKDGLTVIRDFSQQDVLTLDGISFEDLDLVARGNNTLVRFEGESIGFLRGVQSDLITAADTVSIG